MSNDELPVHRLARKIKESPDGRIMSDRAFYTVLVGMVAVACLLMFAFLPFGI